MNSQSVVQLPPEVEHEAKCGVVERAPNQHCVDDLVAEGKVSGGTDEPKRWKANFRCALNSLPDVVEMKQLANRRGSNPYKVYQLLPPRQQNHKSGW